MKINYYIAIAFLVISCGERSKTKKEPKAEIQNAIEVVEANAESLPKNESLDFDKTIANTKAQTPNLPHIEATNFDSFIDEDDYASIDFKAFKLEKIYPDFNAFDNNFRAISGYAVPISDSFHTVVITVQKNENEMETRLINYTGNGEIIAHEIASYDEIAEGWSQVVSRISENKLTVNRIFWGDTKQIEQEEYLLHNNGEIEKLNSKNLNESIKNFALVDASLTELQLDWIQTKTSLITSAPYPNHPNETIIVIPEIVDEGVQYFDLNSHIIIADKRSGKIKNKYFESNETNEWESDAIELDSLQIDQKHYKIAEDKTAFGVKVSHFGHSRVNPYSDKTLSLFVKSGDSLLKVLSNYSMVDYGGEWNGDCDGEFTEEKKRVTLSQEKTNDLFDILINKELTYTEQFKDKNGECLITEKEETKKTVLKYNGWRYSEYELDAKLYAEFHPQKLENIAIDKVHISHAHQLEGFKIVTGYYDPKDGKIVPPDTEKNQGYRLFILNANNEIVYQSNGFGEAYLFEPHFYKNDVLDKTVIICQMGFEYPFGGEAFIVENGQAKHIGTLDIEAYDENFNAYLTDIIEIKESNDGIEFSFKAERLVLSPGTEDSVMVNNNVRYVYKNNKLSLLWNN